MLNGWEFWITFLPERQQRSFEFHGLIVPASLD
jgi:hypothetical protein